MSDHVALTKAEITQLLHALNDDLAAHHEHGEVYVVGGAVMCLAFDARESTRDVDATFKPAAAVRAAAARVGARVGARAGKSENWLNDAVKAFVSTHGTFDAWLELANLRVFLAQPQYVLAMKCMAMRLGAEFHDLNDVRYLIRYLNIESAHDALDIVAQYFDAKDIPPKAQFAVEAMFAGQ
jgi:hypothetical protein